MPDKRTSTITRIEFELGEQTRGFLECALLKAFLDAYNRRTDVMERAVKLDERLSAMKHKLDTSGEALKDAVERNQPNQEDKDAARDY